ncbi:type III secretion system inner membrane ring subunit SctD [Pseudomonas aeruginosa]|uniref:type III secretion system inner membrane ring subunit SctD n=1 Tax=Pseudomonas aeruginosa TaxID=287 RepID=UPI003D2D156E|nr:type III secretion system inner membrane ring subunit SctD [Pseudomonas aeruginosa]
MSPSGFKLKWLNGPFSGRELVLPKGELRIGGPNGDILLPLENMSEGVLTTSEEGVRLSAEGQVWIDGVAMSELDCLPLGQAVDLAGVAFVLGREDMEIAYLSVPARALPQEKTRRRSNLTVAAIFAIGLVSVGLVAWQPEDRVQAFDLEAWLQAKMSEPALQGLRLVRDDRGERVLRGSCERSNSVNALRDALRGRQVHFRDESVCADTVRDSVRKVLELNGYHDVDVTSSMVDAVEVHGAIRADGNWLRTTEQLRSIPGLRDWWVKNDQAELFDRLLASLTEHDLLEGVSLAVSNRTFLVSGELSAERNVALTDLIEAFNETGPRLTAHYQNIPSVPPAAQVLPALIVTVGGTRESIYVELANGMRLQQGSVLPSGYRVHALSRKAISLVRGQQLLSLPIDL